MTVRDLMAALDALAMPDAQVFAQGEDAAPFMLLGGYPGQTSRGEAYVVLASRSLTSQPEGF